MIAGLDKPKQETYLNGQQISGPDPQRGYVFQQGGLFQWMTVEKILQPDLNSSCLQAKQGTRGPFY